MKVGKKVERTIIKSFMISQGGGGGGEVVW